MLHVLPYECLREGPHAHDAGELSLQPVEHSYPCRPSSMHTALPQAQCSELALLFPPISSQNASAPEPIASASGNFLCYMLLLGPVHPLPFLVVRILGGEKTEEIQDSQWSTINQNLDDFQCLSFDSKTQVCVDIPANYVVSSIKRKN
ncbi:hypothetical protein Anapl_04160 [Anas platyrhynchos]|uniref:Uncharacterized protein n=1 Tax=Anas platyrhynchos TaxID=8839 RepID=R0LSX7_ANAPL|nr:hypothetical protein Anapl_04160 [Anas platyrhynchos]